MGSAHSITYEPLEPLLKPAGLYHETIAPKDVAIQLDFTMQWGKVPVVIRADDGTLVAQCIGYDTVNKKKVMLDPQGNHLFRLKHKLSLKPTDVGDDSDEKVLFTLEYDGMFTTHRVVEFTDAFTDKPSVLSISEAPDRTEFHGVKCHVFEIRLDDKGVVARILRPGWPDSSSFYYLQVASGFDMAFMVAVCLSLDEREKQRRRRSRHVAGTARTGGGIL